MLSNTAIRVKGKGLNSEPREWQVRVPSPALKGGAQHSRGGGFRELTNGHRKKGKRGSAWKAAAGGKKVTAVGWQSRGFWDRPADAY